MGWVERITQSYGRLRSFGANGSGTKGIESHLEQRNNIKWASYDLLEGGRLTVRAKRQKAQGIGEMRDWRDEGKRKMSWEKVERQANAFNDLNGSNEFARGELNK